MSSQSFEDFLGSCTDNKATVCIYFAAVLFLLVLVVYHLRQLSASKEHITGVGLGHGGGYSGQTSGATQRFGQEFSGTNQMQRKTVLTADVAEVAPGLSRVGRPVNIFSNYENLVSGRGEPDFWEITGLLDQYKTSQAPGMMADAGSEHLVGAQKIAAAEDDALARLL